VGDGIDILLRDPDASVVRETVPKHPYEPAAVTILTSLIERRRVTFLDIGALYGYFAIYAAKVNPACRIYAFEPNPRFNAVLRGNIELNGVDVNCPEIALAERPETLVMKEKSIANSAGGWWSGITQLAGAALRSPGRHDGGASRQGTAEDGVGGVTNRRWLMESIQHLGRTVRRRPDEFAVQAVDFDSWAEEHDIQPTVAKVDVHGAEGMVLGGMPRALSDHLEALLIEIHPSQMLLRYSHRDILAMLGDAGFSVFEVENFRTSIRPTITPLEGERQERLVDAKQWSAKELMLMRMILAVKDQSVLDTLSGVTRLARSSIAV
jgi:hypothetical protein